MIWRESANSWHGRHERGMAIVHRQGKSYRALPVPGKEAVFPSLAEAQAYCEGWTDGVDFWEETRPPPWARPRQEPEKTP